MKLQEFKKLIREEVRVVVNEQQLQEDLALVGNIALGVAGGLAGLWVLVNGATVAARLLGDAASELGSRLEDKAKAAAMKARREKRLESVKPLLAKFQNDTKLQSMYQALPPFTTGSKSDTQNKERAKQLQNIAKYIKSKLTPEEMDYFTDLSSMLRTGDLPNY